MEISIFGTAACARCKDVVSYLTEKEINFNYKVIGQDVEHQDVNQIVGRMVRAVPVIVVDGDELSFETLKEKINSVNMLNLLEL